MWFILLVPFVTQSARVDQINGPWAVVELWDGELVDLHAECMGPDTREGQSLQLSRARIEACSPGNVAQH